MEQNSLSLPRFDREIQAIIEGRSDTLDLGVSANPGLLREVPPAVRHLTGLRLLRLTGSGITQLPRWLDELPRLQQIDARGCRLTQLPLMPWMLWALDAATVSRLSHLIPLDRVFGVAIGPADEPAAVRDAIRGGRLVLTDLRIAIPEPAEDRDWPNLRTSGPLIDEIIALSPALERLEIAGCPLGRVPGPIRGLRELTELTLAGILPGHLPGWLFDLPALARLDLRDNRLVDLPHEIGRTDRLTWLNLAGNSFRKIPNGVWQLTGLTTLDLRGCPIEQVPAEILGLRALTELRVDRNRPELTVPPPEVTERGLEAIRSYWSQERTSGLDYLAEAKLLIVGEAGAGKTTLARKILDPGYPLAPDEDSTPGIAVSSWQFPAAVRVVGGSGEQLLERDFRVNIWDFGGQEIYHATHQFFLTKRSVYVLLADGRREDTDFRYWLDMVSLLSEDSPLIVVENQRQGRSRRIDVRTLRRDYPHLVDAVNIDLADGTGLPELIGRIRRELELLPHIGTALPSSWRGVREALETDPRDQITAEEFFRICAAHGFQNEDDMTQLGGFLHDLGICLYFQDDPLLRKIVVLKPGWGTQAVYRVLDDPGVRARLGQFGPDDLRRIWHETAYDRMRAELVQLMVKFALCYPVPGTDRFVAPQLLDPDPPEYRWDEPGDLTLRYEYDVMPKGIVRRLIVELHDLIENGAVWRQGAVLAYGSGRAEVIEDYHRGRLTIRLAPRGPRVLLSAIDRALDKIHRSYADLRFRRLRPCDCEVCATAAEPTMFSVAELEDFARGGDRIQCRLSRGLRNAVALLSELWQPEDAAQPIVARRPAEVFVSYTWGGAGEVLTDEIAGQLRARGMVITRDRNEVRYRDSVQRFMRRLGRGDAVVVVLDDAYLKSKSCMFELTEIAGRKDFAKAVHPIVLGDANIFDPIGRLAYVRFWEERRAELDAAMRTVAQDNLQGIREELDLYARIRAMLAGIVDVLADMHTLTVAEHRGSDFRQLYEALDGARHQP